MGSKCQKHKSLAVKRGMNPAIAKSNSNDIARSFVPTNCSNIPVVEKAREQLENAFCCLALSTIKLCMDKPTYYEQIPDIIHTHRLVRQSGIPNF